MTTYHVLLGRPRSIAHELRWTQIRMMACDCIATGKLKVAMPTLGRTVVVIVAVATLGAITTKTGKTAETALSQVVGREGAPRQTTS